eukprot:11185788-Lingulodinium_polyedra.AAC.1
MRLDTGCIGKRRARCRVCVCWAEDSHVGGENHKKWLGYQAIGSDAPACQLVTGGQAPPAATARAALRPK